MSSRQDASSLVTVGGKKQKKRMTAAQRAKRRKLQKMIAAGVLIPVIIFIWWGFQPLKGSMDYGICRTLAELKASNPGTMKIISYENYGSAWKIFYTFTGQYGEQRSNIIDCVFTRDTQGRPSLREVKINRQELSKEEVALFNISIPVVIAAKPDLVIPKPLEKSDIMGLKSAADVGDMKEEFK